VKDKYQTCVFSTTYDSSTDVISDCLNADRVRKRFVATFFSCVELVILWVFSVTTVNIFSSQKLFPMAEFCMAVRSTQLWSMASFEHKRSQGSVATHLRVVGYFIIA